MDIGVLGTGMVGRAIATKLVGLGHRVKMGSRSAENEAAAAWSKDAGEGASHGTFAEAAAFGRMLFNCTAGTGSLAALEAAGAAHLEGKILIDVSNPLDFSKGMPPVQFTPGDDSLGEQIQRTFPDARVVKALNTVNAAVMVDPGRIEQPHEVFVGGNDAEAKARVSEILTDWFGWERVTDLGDITTARGTEAYVTLWIRLMQKLGTPHFNIRIVRAGS